MSHPDCSVSRLAATPALWFAVFGPPAAWFASLVVGYFAVHAACRVHSPLGPRLVSLLALAIAIAGGMTGRAIWRRDAHERTRFMAQLGVLGGGLFSLIIVLQILATLLIPTCHERPRTPQSPDVLLPRAARHPVLPLT